MNKKNQKKQTKNPYKSILSYVENETSKIRTNNMFFKEFGL